MMGNSPGRIEKELQRILKDSSDSGREYLCSDMSCGDVYILSKRLRAHFQLVQNRGGCFCLATEHKGIMAAALLASLGEDCSLLLPFSLQEKSLAKSVRDGGVQALISDRDLGLHRDFEVINPSTLADMEPAGGNRPFVDHELLKIYTGGSTGSPQMWSKTVNNLFGEALFLKDHYGVTEQDTILATIPPNHIYGLLFSVILPLVSGARVVAEAPSFPGEIVRAADLNKASILVSVPAHYRVLRNSSLTLRLAFSSAGMLEKGDNEAFCINNGMGIVEVYGSTETGGLASRNRWRKEEDFTPFPTLDWKIVEGCLAVRSPYISPDLPVDKDGYFKANDRVKERGEGSFALLGRVDNVTKVGGKRVDLEEIRGLIKREPGVVDCAVLAGAQSGGREHRIDVIIQGVDIDLELLRKSLAETLEHYAMPRTMKRVDHIPMKDNGKYDWVAIAQLLVS